MNEREYIKKYIEELSDIASLSEEENKALYKKVLSGELEYKDKLIEGNLNIVPARVSAYLDSGSCVSDMIQEGNLALIDAVEALLNEPDSEIASITDYLVEFIDIALVAYIATESEAKMAANNIKNMANKLLDITTEFEKEHNRPATLDELCKLTGMDKDEVETIVKTSYNAMEIANKTSD